MYDSLSNPDQKYCDLPILQQTARITDIESAALKTEMRGHDNRIECAVFVPMVSIPAIRELVALVGLPYSSDNAHLIYIISSYAARKCTIVKSRFIRHIFRHDGFSGQND